jgi:hypothetical protein
MPDMIPNQDFSIVESNVTQSEWYVTFTRSKIPSSANGVERTLTQSTQSMIWAVGSNSPGGSPSSSFTIHSDMGVLTGNLFSALSSIPKATTIVRPPLNNPSIPNGKSSKTFSKSKAKSDHGILMFVGWAVLTPLGIFIARFYKKTFGVWWFRIHAALMGVFVLALTVAGFVVVYQSIKKDHFDMSKYESSAGLHVVSMLERRMNRF